MNNPVGFFIAIFSNASRTDECDLWFFDGPTVRRWTSDLEKTIPHAGHCLVSNVSSSITAMISNSGKKGPRLGLGHWAIPNFQHADTLLFIPRKARGGKASIEIMGQWFADMPYQPIHLGTILASDLPKTGTINDTSRFLTLIEEAELQSATIAGAGKNTKKQTI